MNWLDVVFVLVIMAACVGLYLTLYFALRISRHKEAHHNPEDAIDQDSKRGNLFKAPFDWNKRE